ncbi:hypothetical protein FUAX_34960 [Fulvitalea axinellae]|uniref:DUF4488 domain-containing protein n=1 Tax=Fulvitalea axinellae TaxID=1182444 RepID=A0AAU9CX44_9BACT|nr:hypothetical protein FUAX_34960 [Fulvitalea axinellae]
MKKIKLVFVAFAVLALASLAIYGCGGEDAINSEESSGSPLVGTWQHCGKDSVPINNYYRKEGLRRFKVFTEKDFVVVNVLDPDKLCNCEIVGSYTLKDSTYVEKVGYVMPKLRMLIGKENTFKFRIEGDYMFVEGTNNPFNEIWKRMDVELDELTKQ